MPLQTEGLAETTLLLTPLVGAVEPTFLQTLALELVVTTLPPLQ